MSTFVQASESPSDFRSVKQKSLDISTSRSGPPHSSIKCLRGDDDLGPVMVMTGVRGRHSISDLLSTPNPLPAGFHYDTSAPGFSTQPPPVPFRSRPSLLSHLSHTPIPYRAYGYAHLPLHPLPAMYDPYLHAPTQIVGAVPPDSSYNTHDYTATNYGVSSSEPFIERHSTDMYFKGDRGLGKEHDGVRSIHIDREAHERVDDDGDGDGDDDDPYILIERPSSAIHIRIKRKDGGLP
ncbi:hypothetical protein M9H77_25628 [Catharanthus roseus]|uniref:Uncharacterized protein n=1 Tax=Catharanthus roseus TaxID=4058 RepID=A0ACC0A8W7_CATRO|nr:hypothetical protein M9H77_25628 [Catharanthus roseus]